jgi:hypothetical protein
MTRRSSVLAKPFRRERASLIRTATPAPINHPVPVHIAVRCNDKRPEQIFPRSLRRRVDRVELPVLLIESFDNVIHRITSCTPAGRRIHPVSTEVRPPAEEHDRLCMGSGAGSLSADRDPALRRHYSPVEQRDSKPRSPLTTTVARLTSTAAFGGQATADAQRIVGFPPISAVRRSCREGQLRVTTG